MAESENKVPRGRRAFLRLAMGGGLVAGYGTWAYMAGRFLYSPGPPTLGWQFVTTVEELPVGASLNYVAPNGARLVVTRQNEGTDANAFTALSSVCPHLGCQVHWEAQNDRFFCPCHNGAFDREGRPIQGPPKAANQMLTAFPLKVEKGLLYVLTPLTSLADDEEGSARA